MTNLRNNLNNLNGQFIVVFWWNL